MKSLVKAINNLANSIIKLADSRKTITSKPVSNITTSTPYGASSNVKSTYISKDTEGWFALTPAEKEQLYYIYKAITVNGADPNYTSQDIVFSRVMDELYANWPSLHDPIQKLILLKKRSIQDKYNKRINPYSKKIWEFPHKHENS
jgi:hypothetical protein